MACGSTTSRHSTEPSASSATPPPARTLVEYRKDGAISKMRSHKGNIPVLPQTKLCPHCPAKFTRTTHLNRHLRTHTGERLHRCDTCEAQFTRSDLLTRHKKTCGDPSHANRTRRRSCQACADSKVKCDLQQPCSKCQARGKECVFVIRNSRSSASAKASTSMGVQSTDPLDDMVSALTSPPMTLIPTSPNSSLPTSPDPNIPSDQLSQTSFNWSSSLPMPDRAVDRSDALSLHSGGPSPSPSDGFSSASDVGSSVASGSVPHQSHLNSLYSSADVLEPFFSNMFNGYNNASLGPDNLHSNPSPVSAATPSPISSVDDTFRFDTQAMEAHHQFHQSDSIFYVPSSNQHQQQVFVPTEQLQRPRYIQDNYIPPYTAPINIRQQAFSEQQHYHAIDSTAYLRNRVKSVGPYQGYGGVRRIPRDGHYSNQLHYEQIDRGAGDAYGRVAEKPYRQPGANQPRVSSSIPAHHWLVPPEAGRADGFEPFPRYGDADDQAYRYTRSECFADPVRWTGSHIMRRQVAGMDLS
ncbi:hypothetical protein HYDPIDRAFT_25946 [Hydnomerulius pinastri MD-312]|nr:hypothetical protein HYDPIDRAFT_25946 [Hydnomerulius pinastri MD-312]